MNPDWIHQARQRIAAELSGDGYSLFTQGEWESIADCMLRAALRRLGVA